MLSEKVYDGLIDLIMRGELVPGEIINRRDIAIKFGVSVAPVLEAMLRLEMDGYLETIPRKGTQVKLIRKEDILGNLLVKTGIECVVVRGICGARVKEKYDELLPIATELEGYFERGDNCFEKWQLDLAFHTELVSLCDNEILKKRYLLVATPSLFYHLNNLIVINGQEKRNSHIDLLNQLTVDDRDAAENAMRNHLFNGKKIMEDYI